MTRYSLSDLSTAYRKAKVDLYYSSEPRRIDLVEYEENLEGNLRSLLQRLNSDDTSWVEEKEFVGSFTVMPKRVANLMHNKRDMIWSDLNQEWTALVARQSGNPPQAEFRLMSRCSIDMHVLSTLWILTVGAKFDAALELSARGSRLRRTRTGAVNSIAPGSFQPYLTPYRRWRDDGIAAMTDALADGKSVVSLTVDATSFFHRLSPTFLLDREFLDGVLGVPLSETERELNSLFVRAMLGWTRTVARETGWRELGLPVGLPASAVVANLALVELDRLAIEEFRPLYYGRYVDDVILVLEGGDRLATSEEVWDWLIHRSRGLLKYVDSNDESSSQARSIQFVPGYLDDSEIAFDNEKNKIFHLSGQHGIFVVASIKRAIDQRASEWRAMPSLARTPAAVGVSIASVTTDDGDDALTLRHADKVSAKRSLFAIRLRDLEAYERNVERDSWSVQRGSFFESVCSHVVVMPNFFDFATYIPRLIKLAASCEDFASLQMLLQSLERTYLEAVRDCMPIVNAYSTDGDDTSVIWERWRSQLVGDAIESVACGLAAKVSAQDLARALEPLVRLAPPSSRPLLRVLALRRWHRRFFVRDLAHVPYRFAVLGPDLAHSRGIPRVDVRGDEAAGDVALDETIGAGLDLLV